MICRAIIPVVVCRIQDKIWFNVLVVRLLLWSVLLPMCLSLLGIRIGLLVLCLRLHRGSVVGWKLTLTLLSVRKVWRGCRSLCLLPISHPLSLTLSAPTSWRSEWSTGVFQVRTTATRGQRVGHQSAPTSPRDIGPRCGCGVQNCSTSSCRVGLISPGVVVRSPCTVGVIALSLSWPVHAAMSSYVDCLLLLRLLSLLIQVHESRFQAPPDVSEGYY